MQVWQKNLQQFDRWLAGREGQLLLQLQLPILQRSLKKCSSQSEKALMIIYNGHRYCKLQHDYQQVVHIASDDEVAVDLVAAPFALPFAADSVDTIILPYVLEAMPEILSIMAEAHRVLKPQGVIVISGLNNVSLLRMQRPKSLVALNFFNIDDIQRDLFLTGFDLIERKKFSFTRLRSGVKSRWEQIGKYCWPFLANSYILTMQKRVAEATLTNTAWRKELLIKNARLANVMTERKAIGKS